jgi:hypothetical protein
VVLLASKAPLENNRTPFTTNLDLGAYMPIKIGENKELRFTADLVQRLQ